MNDDAWKDEAKEHAVREYPREACGLVVVLDGGLRTYWPCANVAQGMEHFEMAPADYAAAEDRGQVAGVFHSHPNASCKPSQADRVSCEASGLPWWIVGLPHGEWGYCEPCGYTAPLVGREFSHGILDCYALVRDWYRLERGIELPDFERRDNWWNEGADLYRQHFAGAGFREIQVGHARDGDAVLMAIRSPVPNHAAILLDHGGTILHHMQGPQRLGLSGGKLSCRETYMHYYRTRTTHVLRHKLMENEHGG